jgi:ABC-type multidrug transport system ATPase subunit
LTAKENPWFGYESTRFVCGGVRGGSLRGNSFLRNLKHYRAEIVYSGEDDIHFPPLTVRQTIFFALLTKIRRREFPLAQEVMDVMGKVFGISKVFNTIVGDGFIRGVSGGERKRDRRNIGYCSKYYRLG